MGDHAQRDLAVRGEPAWKAELLSSGVEPAFFIPGVPRREAEHAYELIRTDTERRTGGSTSERRIASLACRRGGKDYEAKVGGRDAVAGRVVVAIFDLGQKVYAIRCAEPDHTEDRAWAEPIVVGKHQIYSVTEFPN